MRRMLIIVLFILSPGMILAYEPGALNLKTPTNLEKGQGEFKIQHRFYGKVSDNSADTFLGMDLGANVGISLRYAVWSNLELNFSRIRDGKEYNVGVSYAYLLPRTPLHSQIDAQFFSYGEYNVGRKSGVFGLFSLRSNPIFFRVTPVINVGYDSYNRELGAGFGLAIVALKDLGIIRKISAIGEYFPTKGESENRKSYSFGLRLETYGHHFDLILSNSSEISLRRLMSGTTENEGFKFGFNIKRRI